MIINVIWKMKDHPCLSSPHTVCCVVLYPDFLFEKYQDEVLEKSYDCCSRRGFHLSVEISNKQIFTNKPRAQTSKNIHEFSHQFA